MPDKEGLLTRQEAADLLGCTVSNIDNLVQSGKLARAGRGKFDPVELERYRGTMSMPHYVQQQVVKAQGGQRASKGPDLNVVEGGKQGPQSGNILIQARTKNEVLKAQRSELEYRKAKGELVPRDEVKQQAAAITRVLSNTLRALPRRVSGEIAILQDPKEVMGFLEKEINAALEQAQDELAAL